MTKKLALWGTTTPADRAAVGAYLVQEIGQAAAVVVRRWGHPERRRTLAEDRESLAYALQRNPVALLKKGTATRTYWDVGADPVLGLRVREEGVSAGLAAASAAVPEARTWLVFDAAPEIGPVAWAAELTVLVIANGTEALPVELGEAAEQADAIVVVHARPGATRLPCLGIEAHDDAPDAAPDGEVEPHVPAAGPALFRFHRHAPSVTADDRQALVGWVTHRLDLDWAPAEAHASV